jgi:N-methylhydantoinase B/oxoprolinase/acetone carboxylase alpha subunit
MFGAAGAWSTGGSPYRDGDYAATCGLNPQSDMGEFEEWDLYQPPLVSLARKLTPNHYGHGKFRGGVGTNWVFLVVNKGKSLTVSFATGGGIQTGLQVTGKSGGYPGYGDWSAIFLGTNALELIEKGMGYPTTFQEIMQWIREGKLKVDRIIYTPGEVPPIELQDGDIYVLGTHGDAGWGDPIERSPSLIERDLNEGWVTPGVAKGVYGAIAQATKGKWKVDEEGTLKERQQMRERRREKAKPFREWWRQERERVLNKEFREEVCYIYQDILQNEKSGPQFRGFWQVGEDYQL